MSDAMSESSESEYEYNDSEDEDNYNNESSKKSSPTKGEPYALLSHKELTIAKDGKFDSVFVCCTSKPPPTRRVGDNDLGPPLPHLLALGEPRVPLLLFLLLDLEQIKKKILSILIPPFSC
tara:strand:+ start:164 stop:526 length:363 start_codon:yes stop_codon:yes gene_type:complete